MELGEVREREREGGGRLCHKTANILCFSLSLFLFRGVLTEQLPKVLYDMMPVIWLKPSVSSLICNIILTFYLSLYLTFLLCLLLQPYLIYSITLKNFYASVSCCAYCSNCSYNSILSFSHYISLFTQSRRRMW